MDEAGFRKFIREGKRVPKGLTEKTVRSHIKIVKEFEAFLKAKGKKKDFANAGAREVKSFIAHLAEEGRSAFDEFLGLLRYSRFCGNADVEFALIMALDGAKVMDDLLEVVRKKHGKRKYEEVFGGFEPPAIGTPAKKMPKATCAFMGRLESGLGVDGAREVLLVGVHAGSPKYYVHERKMLREAEDIDDYLRMRREKMIELLEGHERDKTPFYNQMIDKDALDFVRANPEVAGGVRRGRKIYQTKIPYMMIEYLKEKDERMKRYYGCHCLLARESILTGEKMSRNLCYCSAGYEKMPYEVAFGKPVKTEVLKSILWGDTVCRFAMEIPEEHLPKDRKRGAARARKKKARQPK